MNKRPSFDALLNRSTFLCVTQYFLEHALFPKQSGEFEILSWFICYELFLSCQWPNNCTYFVIKLDWSNIPDWFRLLGIKRFPLTYSRSLRSKNHLRPFLQDVIFRPMRSRQSCNLDFKFCNFNHFLLWNCMIAGFCGERERILYTNQ